MLLCFALLLLFHNASEYETSTDQEASIAVAMFIVVILGSFVGIGFGIGGICQQKRKKILAVMGLVFNMVVLFSISALILIGIFIR